MQMVLYNDHGEVTLTEDDWDKLIDAAEGHGWEPVDRPDHGHALSADDAQHLAEALHTALDSGDAVPHQLIDDPDAEEVLEHFLEICEAGAVAER
ncbi:hypothetical protein OT109_13445 [Phycisphaeraceae bacterium D3-23]